MLLEVTKIVNGDTYVDGERTTINGNAIFICGIDIDGSHNPNMNTEVFVSSEGSDPVLIRNAREEWWTSMDIDSGLFDECDLAKIIATSDLTRSADESISDARDILEEIGLI